MTGVVLNTLFSASGYRIAIKICKDCALENNEAVEKFDNYTKTSRKVVKFWNRAFGWLCLSIYIVKKLNVQTLECILSWHGKLLHGNCILMSYSDRVRSRMAWGRSFTPNVRRSLPARLYVFITESKKSKLRRWFNRVLITQLDKNLTLAWLMIS